MDSNSKFPNLENIITTILLHDHPLQLVDLQPRYPDYVEFSDDEEEDRVVKWDYNHTCNHCHKDINVYHRYYYKCTDSCDYALHTLCAKLPKALIVKSHNPSHTLTLDLIWGSSSPFRYCDVCSDWESEYLCYGCSICRHKMVCMKCAMIGRKNHIIYHPSHPHPLQSVTSEPILCTCDACGKEHKGIFYHCTTCFHHSIHIDCAFLPRKLHIQHTHPLIISYSSQDITSGSKCRICSKHFNPKYLWSYQCESCRYYVHLDCATSPAGRIGKNFKDADHPNLVNLPFPDQRYSILKHRFSKELGSTSESSLNHISHQHVLSLVGTQSTDSKGATSSSSISSFSCHNPMKRIELLCNGCVRPIMDVPFYKCSSEDQSCNFVLHEWCTRLPAKLPNHPGHQHHTLTFLPKVLTNIFGIFSCRICKLYCNGFAFGCTKCHYYIDVNCGFIPDEITHEAHPDHILSRWEGRLIKPCAAEGWKSEYDINFSCRSCDFNLHSNCALFLPGIIHHNLDKHPMRLTYGPVENHKSEYFCEVCEVQLDPNLWFYHCHVCAYSLHTRCAPVILNFEAAVGGYESLYRYLNIKFGGIYNIKGHEHSVSLALGSDADGECSICHSGWLKNKIIMKCPNCKLAMHYDCSLGDDLALEMPPAVGDDLEPEMPPGVTRSPLNPLLYRTKQ